MNPAQENDLSLADRVAIELRADIIGGRLLPGMALVESELVKAYSASRNTVREALHHLGREGLTLYVRNKGVMVRRMGVADVRDIFHVRRTLELQALTSRQPLHSSLLALMGDAIEAAELAQGREDWQAFGTHSLRFHQHIVGLLRSPLFDEFFTHVAAQLRLVFSSAASEEHFQKPWLDRDRQIHELLCDGRQQEAHEAMSLYLNDSEHELLDIFSRTAKP